MPNPLTQMDDTVLCALAKDGDSEAAGVLIERHKGMIFKIAKPIWAKHADRIDIDDLVQEAKIQMFRAIHKFDPKYGVKFLTFAAKFLWKPLHTIATRSGVISGRSSQLNKPGFSVPVVSLDAVRADKRGDERAMIDSLPMPALDLAAYCDDRERLAQIEHALGVLSPRSRDVLRRRIAGETLDSVGGLYGITKERVRQIELAALKELRYLCHQSESGPSMDQSHRA